MKQQQFWDVADNWYQRTVNLAWVWQDEALPQETREKAFRLWKVMFARMQKITSEAIRLRTPQPIHFEPGGVHAR